ncbi:MAG: tRNA (adenosine(37)-N6)-threonylcarbamoyltransferase complex transferase subunit TsaD [Planctomycetota bacterium]|nr:tRNA (adenosine(37)-N6)-threonylcarbamoyltransferase complex transferase subunit TsaD [Planctomycetota bacterium]MDP6761307.1 tRNA (adenosine(37)-N6)-threonylcarbamoyltransferase complex transferase subunit TsaD [Planctomycetota bacterium]MDP6991018.1 tRNA (adenosine(37)-N6)-threonylcarbamoyltransferase complex transferase subunit TsaD [Planctomycetota bacterium]
MSERILGIETSCDETAAAVVRGGREVLSSVVHSQIDEHAEYGGVVPEIAGRSHLRELTGIADRALEEAGLGLEDLDAVAVTTRPGLIGSLLVGVSTAKGLAYGTGLPLVGVHHIEAHVYAATMECESAPYPCIALVVSGGHTALYRAESPLEHTLLASTLDDAAGEAFDKVAWLLGLPYPGGPSVSALAREGRPDAIAFPRYRAADGGGGFSFSGLKTAVLYHLRGGDALAPTPPPERITDRADVAASFEQAVVDSLVDETFRAAGREELDTILVAGGVACNRRLREEMTRRGSEDGRTVVFPSPAYCTDNAVMIAGLGTELLRAGRTCGWDLDASPR